MSIRIAFSDVDGTIVDTNHHALPADGPTLRRVTQHILPEKEAAPASDGLFDQLRALRKDIAREENIPPYLIFSDKTLRGMCELRPKTEEELADVSGVGEKKLAKYGARFLACLRENA